MTDAKDRFNLSILFLLLIVSTLVEMIGIGSIPIFAMVIFEPNLIIEKIPSYFNFEFILEVDKKKLTLYSSMIILFIFLLKNIYLGFFNYFNVYTIQRIRSNLYNKMFNNYIQSNYEFHIKRNPADLIRNITTEVSKAVHYMMSFILLIKESLIMIMIFLLLLIADTYVSIFIFSILGFFSVIFFIFTRKGSKIRGKKIQEYWGKQIKVLNHALGSIKQIKILNKENFMYDLFKDNTDIIVKYDFIQSFLVTLPRLFLETVTILAVVTVSITFVFSDRLIESFVPLIVLITVSAVRLIPSFNTISSSLATIKYQKPSFDLILKELEDMKKIISKNQIFHSNKLGKRNINFKNSIDIKNLVYFYPGTKKTIINDISFSISFGDVIGFAGESGEGKSTLLDLITGLLIPSKGKILVDGYDINESYNNWRLLMGYVPQEIYLLDDSIKANIAFGAKDEEFNQKDFEKALELAQLFKFVEGLPEKENTFVGDRGIRLSGGQKQRIGIARSLYLKPKILILDEPTSFLDIKNENLILNDIYKLRETITVIIISHRFGALKKCNKLFNIRNGKIKPISNYNDLI